MIAGVVASWQDVVQTGIMAVMVLGFWYLFTKA
jgi:hypothetical protein